MNNKNPNIDQQLQDKFSEFAPMPAAFAWDQLDAKLDYYNIIGSKSNINFTLGTILSRQQFNSNIFQFPFPEP